MGWPCGRAMSTGSISRLRTRVVWVARHGCPGVVFMAKKWGWVMRGELMSVTKRCSVTKCCRTARVPEMTKSNQLIGWRMGTGSMRESAVSYGCRRVAGIRWARRRTISISAHHTRGCRRPISLIVRGPRVVGSIFFCGIDALRGPGGGLVSPWSMRRRFAIRGNISA